MLLNRGIGAWLDAVEVSSSISDGLAEVGPRLKRVRTERYVTPSELAATTGISKSTESGSESGPRRPERGEPQLRTHEGYEWLHVLAGEP